MTKKKSKPQSPKPVDWGALRPDNPTTRPLHIAPKPVKLADDPVEKLKETGK